MYYTYMIRCIDNSIYTGMTNNLENRMLEHSTGTGAKYTKSHGFKMLEIAWSCETKSLACKLEYNIKTLCKNDKEKLIKSGNLEAYFSNKIDLSSYKKISTQILKNVI